MPLKIKDFTYHVDTGIIHKQNKQHKLTKIQKKLFDYFLAHPKQVISKETLMKEVWGRIVTDNTINKFISVLRSYVELDPTSPSIIVTHFGHGLSFEAEMNDCEDEVNQASRQVKSLLAVVGLSLLTVMVFIIWINFTKPAQQNESIVVQKELQENAHVLILPTSFEALQISEEKQTGLREMIKSTFNNSDSEGQMVFEQTNLGNREAIEKYWQLDKSLVVLQSKVLKNGDVYEAVIKLSQGSEVLRETKISANNLNELLKNQIGYIANYQRKKPTEEKGISNKITIDDAFLEALGNRKLGNVNEAKSTLLKILERHEDYYPARFELAKMLIKEKKYNKSLSHLQTLKSTPAYQLIGSEIELSLAKIKFIQHQYTELIEQLKTYQASHIDIGEVKKTKIKLQIADAYLALGDLQNAMNLYKLAIVDIQDDFNPELFAQSLFGQAMIMIHQSNSDEVYDLFEQALTYAKVAGNFKLQILSLDEMAKMLLVSNQWDKGIALKKQALAIMELESDKSEVAQGLGTLAAFLIQTGHFTEAKNINDRMGNIAQELNLDTLYLSYLHYDAVLLLNVFKFEEAEMQINKQLELAIEKNNYGMQLDNAFLEFEMRLARKDLSGFKKEWDKRTQMIKDMGFERYQVYMDLYLARYYKQTANIEKASVALDKISSMAKDNNDIKILVDAQNQLAEMYLEIDAQKSLSILENIEQYKPDANPYLELKALALNKLGRKIEALNLLNQAKLVFHEAWKSENQILLEQLQQQLH